MHTDFSCPFVSFDHNYEAGENILVNITSLNHNAALDE